MNCRIGCVPLISTELASLASGGRDTVDRRHIMLLKPGKRRHGIIAHDAGDRSEKRRQPALGDKRGITRYAHAYLPMDETLVRAALDISGRPYLIWRVAFPAQKIGAMDTELFREFFQALAQNAGITVHIELLYGENSHHIAESSFKGLARALAGAIAIDERAKGEVPSTKGQLGS